MLEKRRSGGRQRTMQQSPTKAYLLREGGIDLTSPMTFDAIEEETKSGSVQTMSEVGFNSRMHVDQ